MGSIAAVFRHRKGRADLPSSLWQQGRALLDPQGERGQVKQSRGKSLPMKKGHGDKNLPVKKGHSPTAPRAHGHGPKLCRSH